MLKLGLAGVRRGRIAQLVAKRTDVTFAAVCDPRLADDDTRRGVLDDFAASGAAFDEVYTDFDAFLDHDMDVVLIASPAPLHASQSIAALQAGHDVICEVPAVTSLEEARELVVAVRETGRRYLFAENCCYWGFVKSWVKMIRDGRIGVPYYLEGEYVHDVRNLMTDEEGNHTWRAAFNPVQYCTHETGPLFDMLDDRGVAVSALVTGGVVAPEFPAPDAGVALVTTKKGAVVKLLACFKNAVEPAYHRYLVFGSEGSLETRTTEPVTYATFNDIPHLQGRVSLPLGTGLRGTLDQGGHGGADAAMMNHFFDALAQDGPLPIDVYRGLDYTLPGVCAALSAEEGGTAVTIPNPRGFV